MTTLEPANARPRPGWLRSLVAKREYALSLVIACILLAVTIRNPRFMAVDNVWDLLTNCSQPAIIGCGVMLVIVTGEIDISVGAMLGFLTALLGWMASPAHYGWSPAVAIVATLALGALLGLTNGLLVTLVRIPSIIVTLAMMTILRGLTVLVMKPGDITDMPAAVRFFGIGTVLDIPVSLIVAAWVIGGTIFMLRHLPVGRRIFAVGSNAHAARLSGLSTTRIRIFVFMLTGLLVGVATLTSRLATVTSGFGQGLELLVVTCVVVGGVSISGGTGTVLGVVLGVFLLCMQKPVLIFLNLGTNAAYWEKAIQGGLILVAVLVDHLAGKKTGGAGGSHG